jgi:hypothetical protein
MQTVYTDRDTLIQRVLEKLKVVAVGQPASAAEYEAVDQRLDFILTEIAARNIVTVFDTSQIPAEILEALAGVVGRHTAALFSIQEPELGQLFMPEEHPYSPENRCRAIVRSRPHRAPAVADYY